MSRSPFDRRETWIGLDIGGANLKAAHADGSARVVPFELWKRPDDLAVAIRSLVSTLPPSTAAAVTMTAELCDCYPTRRVGVLAVLDAVRGALPDRPVAVWGTDEDFHPIEEILERPMLAAAANWLALARLAARLVPDGPAILIDIGSTTSDLIPIAGGGVAARGRTDTERLQSGELVYAGVRRTPIHALASELPLRGVPTGLAAEVFATTLDVYLTLGEIAADPLDLSTADGRPATVAAARDRLARMVCADRESFSTDDAHALAVAADRVLTDRLVARAERACGAAIGRPRAAIVAGSGTFLSARVAGRCSRRATRSSAWTRPGAPTASAAGCAFALVRLAEEWPNEGPHPPIRSRMASSKESPA